VLGFLELARINREIARSRKAGPGRLLLPRYRIDRGSNNRRAAIRRARVNESRGPPRGPPKRAKPPLEGRPLVDFVGKNNIGENNPHSDFYNPEFPGTVNCACNQAHTEPSLAGIPTEMGSPAPLIAARPARKGRPAMTNSHKPRLRSDPADVHEPPTADAFVGLTELAQHLPARQLQVLIALLRFCSTAPRCWPAQKILAESLRCSVGKVNRGLHELSAAGVVAIRYQRADKKRRACIYEIAPGYWIPTPENEVVPSRAAP
jgi:hypothetical protein